MNKYEFKNNQFEISDARKRFLINKFAEQHHKSGKNDDSEYIYDIVERMDNDFKIPLNTPLKSFDNEMFIKQQKLVVDCEPAIAIDWVASLVSHMKKITNLDSPKVLQVFSDNVYLQKALSHCSIETVAYQKLSQKASPNAGGDEWLCPLFLRTHFFMLTFKEYYL